MKIYNNIGVYVIFIVSGTYYLNYLAYLKLRNDYKYLHNVDVNNNNMQLHNLHIHHLHNNYFNNNTKNDQNHNYNDYLNDIHNQYHFNKHYIN